MLYYPFHGTRGARDYDGDYVDEDPSQIMKQNNTLNQDTFIIGCIFSRTSIKQALNNSL